MGSTHLEVYRKIIHTPFPLRLRFVDYPFYILLWCKELHERFLINISSRRSPPENGIGRLCTIHCRLRTNCPPPSFGEFLELKKNDFGFFVERAVGEWCVRNF
jgi:hypothetical protein